MILVLFWALMKSLELSAYESKTCGVYVHRGLVPNRNEDMQ